MPLEGMKCYPSQAEEQHDYPHISVTGYSNSMRFGTKQITHRQKIRKNFAMNYYGKNMHGTGMQRWERKQKAH
tara:strand:+ start:1228 stop:1446 length:219 start_codon:yes stop_codon:yes gene_type:complete